MLRILWERHIVHLLEKYEIGTVKIYIEEGSKKIIIK